MGMINVNYQRTGKLLNNQRRRQQRSERSSPYGRHSSSRGEKYKSAGTDGGNESCLVASNVRESVGGDDPRSRLQALERTSFGHEK